MLLQVFQRTAGRHRRLIGVGLVVLSGVVLLLGVLAYPWLLLQAAGRHLTSGDISRAVADFRQVVVHLPESVFAWRRLAQAELLHGDPAAAVVALEQARILAPEDPLVLYELAIAYEASGDLAAADTLWLRLERSAGLMGEYGQRAFELGNYTAAYQWFDRAVRNNAVLSSAQRFQYRSAAVLSQAPTAELMIEEAVFLPSNTSIRIAGGQFRWLRSRPRWNIASGTALGSPDGIGTFRWDGPAAVMVSVAEAGTYLLRVNAQHGAPPPIDLAIGINGRQLHQVRLDRGDASSTTVEFLIELQSGPQAVVVWFLNDGAVNGVDRNAVLEWVEVAPAN